MRRMKYYLAILKLVDQEMNSIYRPDHLNHVEKYVQEGKIALCGPFIDGSGGAIVYIAGCYEEAVKLAEMDPYVVKGARNLQLQEWGMQVKNLI